ncbi:copper homeostasis protein [Luteibacter rhizovicinus]|uniref:PF03932 family protein CutC n=2 Tax=Luteibacter rhizovicinus TaxID=242606 RepID=A0A4R3YY00_9GAMM|nr:copper homeostasis protein CutC [Luteibacter rhizovicinus]TCV97520.1 copper homeostasis protein [Luteibacter rhizovicinus]
MTTLEIAAGSLVSARVAQEAGATRVELCASLESGGVTPSYGQIATVRDALRIPLYVLIRPRAGDFFYDGAERDTMLADIGHCVRAGCDGVVIGALDADGDVDMSFCRELIAEARGLGITFHRAFDVTRDQCEALERIVSLGCERVLTSGGMRSAWAGRERIAALVRQADARISIMAGAGVDPSNVAALVAETRVREVHASARKTQSPATRFLPADDLGMGSSPSESDDATIRRLLVALDETGGRDQKS